MERNVSDSSFISLYGVNQKGGGGSGERGPDWKAGNIVELVNVERAASEPGMRPAQPSPTREVGGWVAEVEKPVRWSIPVARRPTGSDVKECGGTG